jgi:phosphotransferase system enzyme I (PtsI)
VYNVKAKMSQMADSYLKERISDLEDIEQRIVKCIVGKDSSDEFDIDEPSIIVADDLTPSETVLLPREKVLGFATDCGSKTSHVALLSRAMGVPFVAGLGDISKKVFTGDNILLDGSCGVVTVNPAKQAVGEFLQKMEDASSLSSSFDKGKIGVLKDGGRVALYANVHPHIELEGLDQSGAQGIGLYRSEYLWINNQGEPSEDAQFQSYSQVASLARSLWKDAPIVIRALDIGGDKTVSGTTSVEENPFLGNRSIRFLLSNESVFRRQIRAILRASESVNMSIMYPMISCVEEVLKANAIVEEEKKNLEKEGLKFVRDVKVGVMIEVPSAALNADSLAKHVDFFSIGTNDLIQYTLAADRSNKRVSHLYQPTNGAVIKLIELTVAAAKKEGIPVSVCGESASDPVLGVLWLALGVDSLSLSASYIKPISKLLNNLSRQDLDEYASCLSEGRSGKMAAEVYDRCKNFLLTKVPELKGLMQEV